MTRAYTLIELHAVRKGFTLIELLVVITIIVVLLALLTPALDKAIYQAELAVCGAKLDAIAPAVTSYAMEFKRRYPYRTGVDTGGERRPSELKIFLPGDARDGDDRPIIKDYIPLNHGLVCPLDEQIDVEGSDDDTHIMLPYALWYGWHYTAGGVKHKGMKRLGDSFSWTERTAGAGPLDPSIVGKTYRFRVLAADMDAFGSDQPVVQAGHPDKEGILTSVTHQNNDAVLGGGLGAFKYTTTYWEGPVDDRGHMDRNFVYQDGSTQRLTDLVLYDERMARIPERSNPDNEALFFTWLPPN